MPIRSLRGPPGITSNLLPLHNACLSLCLSVCLSVVLPLFGPAVICIPRTDANEATSPPVPIGLFDCCCYYQAISLTNHLGQLSLASLRVAKSSTSFGWGKGGNVTSAEWQLTLCDPIWHVSSRSGDGRPACKLLYARFTFTYKREGNITSK